MSNPQETTPMVQQYQRTKAQHPDAILLFRIGDFYETFGDDAKAASEILNITLTRKHVGNGNTLPLAGIPFHALDGYVAKLIRAGRRVAICDQVEDAKSVKGKAVVRREVTRVVTPGTVIEEGLLDEKSNNYLAAATRHKGNWGLALAELSTGALMATEFTGEEGRGEIAGELTRIAPAEWLATEEDAAMLSPLLDELQGATAKRMLTRIDKGMARFEDARRELLDHFKVATLQGFGAEDSPAAVAAAGALLTYLRETQRRALGHIRHLEIYSTHQAMFLDAVTQRSLELVGNMIDGGRAATLLSTVDQTRTPMGGRLLRRWLLAPLQDLSEIKERQDAIEALFVDGVARDAMRDSLRGVRDLERLLARLHCGVGTARDLSALVAGLREAPSIKSALLRLGAGALGRLGAQIETLAPLADTIESALVADPPATTRDGGMIRDGHDAKLDELRSVTRDGKGWIAKLRAEEIQKTGINSLKIGYNRVFGYYIEIGKSHLEKVPENWIRRQTLTNGERYITPELKEQEELILGAEGKIQELELEIFERLRTSVLEKTREIQALAAQFAETDALASLAEAARRGGWVRPAMDDSGAIEIEQGRHPVLESLMTDRPFVANDARLDGEREQIWLITGPNMAGKSTFIRQVALLTLMAHVGSFIPARRARIGLVDRIFTRVGATDYLARGQSTFLVEMTETANILRHATEKSLVILDEIGRGTSTYDGLSIAWAVAEYLHEKPQRRAKTLFATHYHELTDLENRLPRVKNYNVAVHEGADGIAFLYRIVAGHADRSYGIYAAQLAGMPEETLVRAREILFSLECNRATPGETTEAGSEAGEGSGIPRLNNPAGSDPPSSPSANKSAASNRKKIPLVRDIDIMQLDLFGAELPPEFAELDHIDVNRLTPVEAMRILDALVRAWKGRKG